MYTEGYYLPNGNYQSLFGVGYVDCCDICYKRGCASRQPWRMPGRDACLARARPEACGGRGGGGAQVHLLLSS